MRQERQETKVQWPRRTKLLYENIIYPGPLFHAGYMHRNEAGKTGNESTMAEKDQAIVRDLITSLGPPCRIDQHSFYLIDCLSAFPHQAEADPDLQQSYAIYPGPLFQATCIEMRQEKQETMAEDDQAIVSSERITLLHKSNSQYQSTSG